MNRAAKVLTLPTGLARDERHLLMGWAKIDALRKEAAEREAGLRSLHERVARSHGYLPAIRRENLERTIRAHKDEA